MFEVDVKNVTEEGRREDQLGFGVLDFVIDKIQVFI